MDYLGVNAAWQATGGSLISNDIPCSLITSNAIANNGSAYISNMNYAYGSQTAVTTVNCYWDVYVQQMQTAFENYEVANTYTVTLETAEETAAREKFELNRKEAQLRAEELLLDCLSPEQIKQYNEQGYFETEVNDSVYRIKKGRTGNVELIDNGKPKYRYCVHPNEWTPDQDVMLSQLLMLKTNEAEFIKTANRTVLSIG